MSQPSHRQPPQQSTRPQAQRSERPRRPANVTGHFAPYPPRLPPKLRNVTYPCIYRAQSKRSERPSTSRPRAGGGRRLTGLAAERANLAEARDEEAAEVEPHEPVQPAHGRAAHEQRRRPPASLVSWLGRTRRERRVVTELLAACLPPLVIHGVNSE